jgi:phosphohistidine phosphatase
MIPMGFTSANPLLQASVIPYRHRDGGPEFCLITSIRKGRWGFPKGIIDPGETAEETALKEAEEEAGLYGRIEGGPLGGYEYYKWGTVLSVTVFLMHVTAAADDWDEADVRERDWFGVEEARGRIDRVELRELLDAAAERIEAVGE